MRLDNMRWSFPIAALVLGMLGVAAAQTGTAGNAPPVITAPREVNLPVEQQLALGRQYLLRMDQSTTTVRSQLEQARASRDVVKALCLGDKLNQIEVAARSGRDRLTTLQAAADAKDKDRAKHEFMIVQVLRERVEQLVKEANQCIGEEAGFLGESSTTVQIDPNIPRNDPDQLGFDPTIISEPPVLSSPTL